MARADLSVDWRTATSWHIDLKALRIDLHRPAQAQAWAVAWHELERDRCGNGLSAILKASSSGAWNSVTSVTRRELGQRGEQAVQVLLDATGTFHLDRAISAIKPLIGLGPGLTPSGDDFLVGYLAGLWSTVGSDSARMRFLTAVGSWLTEAAVSTNSISAAYLKSAVRGNVAEPVATLARQIAHAHPDGARAATRTALSVGHTSGADGVLGLLLGSLAWEMPALACRFNQSRSQQDDFWAPRRHQSGTEQPEVVEPLTGLHPDRLRT